LVGCARQVRADARQRQGGCATKAGRLREARQGRCSMQFKADATCKARQMRKSRQCRCERKGRADARSNAVTMREAR
jgi:hypothetical protein